MPLPRALRDHVDEDLRLALAGDPAAGHPYSSALADFGYRWFHDMMVVPLRLLNLHGQGKDW